MAAIGGSTGEQDRAARERSSRRQQEERGFPLAGRKTIIMPERKRNGQHFTRVPGLLSVFFCFLSLH